MTGRSRTAVPARARRSLGRQSQRSAEIRSAQRVGVVGDVAGGLNFRREPGGDRARDDARQSRRDGFEHLVLDAARRANRRRGDRRFPQPRSHVRHVARHDHRRIDCLEPLQLRRGDRSPPAPASRRDVSRARSGQTRSREPLRGLGIRLIAHHAAEHDLSRIGRRPGRRKAADVDAVLDDPHVGVRRHARARVCASRSLTTVVTRAWRIWAASARCQQASLPPINPGHRRRRRRAERAPFRRVDVDHVDDRRPRGDRRLDEQPRHARAIGEHRHRVETRPAIDGELPSEMRRVEQRKRQRRRGREASRRRSHEVRSARHTDRIGRSRQPGAHIGRDGSASSSSCTSDSRWISWRAASAWSTW